MSFFTAHSADSPRSQRVPVVAVAALTVALALTGCTSATEAPEPTFVPTHVITDNEDLIELSFKDTHASVVIPKGFIADKAIIEKFEGLSLGDEAGYEVRAWAGKNTAGDTIILTITESRDNVLYNRDTGVVEFSVPFSGEDVLRDDPKFQVPGALASRLVVGRLEVDGAERTGSQLVAIVRDDKESAAWVMLGVNEGIGEGEESLSTLDNIVDTLTVQ